MRERSLLSTPASTNHLPSDHSEGENSKHDLVASRVLQFVTNSLGDQRRLYRATGQFKWACEWAGKPGVTGWITRAVAERFSIADATSCAASHAARA
jgi:hypothetical protein